MMTVVFGSNVLADELLDGFALSSAQSTQGDIRNYSPGLSGLFSLRPNRYYGTEFQLGLFGQSGPFDYNIWVDGAATGFLPVGDGGFNLYAKAGLALIYSFESNGVVSILAPTYGAGIEYKGKKGAVRLGVQHYNVGNVSLSPSLSANLIGISLLRRIDY